MARPNVEGIEQVRRVFRRLPQESLERITNALNKGAAEIEADAKEIAPDDTGELRGAIEVRRDLKGFSARGIVGAFNRGGEGESKNAVRRFIGIFPKSRADDGWYGAFVEFGTAPRVKGQSYKQASGRRKKTAGNTHPGSKAKPFMFPAFWKNRKRATRRISREINQAVKIVARGAR